MKRYIYSMGMMGLLIGMFAGKATAGEAESGDKADLPPDEEVAVITTEHGEMIVRFWPEVAPNTVENFKKLAKEEFYDKTAFHRIIKGFMIQGGDPNTKPGERGRPGTGGPGYHIDAEFNDRPHEKGVISMARSQDPNSAGSQFFICHGRAAFLDGQYTAFGKLVEGYDVLDKIAETPVAPGPGGEPSRPEERQEVETVRIVPASEALGES